MSDARELWFTRPRHVEVRSAPVPLPRPGQVLVRGVASGLSQGTELLLYRGEGPTPFDPSVDMPGTYPCRYGDAWVGMVESADPAAPQFEPGRHVFALAPHGTHHALDVACVHSLDADIPPERAVLAANLIWRVPLPHLRRTPCDAPSTRGRPGRVRHRYQPGPMQCVRSGRFSSRPSYRQRASQSRHLGAQPLGDRSVVPRGVEQLCSWSGDGEVDGSAHIAKAWSYDLEQWRDGGDPALLRPTRAQCRLARGGVHTGDKRSPALRHT